jgi:hypothetical protein
MYRTVFIFSDKCLHPKMLMTRQLKDVASLLGRVGPMLQHKFERGEVLSFRLIAKAAIESPLQIFSSQPGKDEPCMLMLIIC